MSTTMALPAVDFESMTNLRARMTAFTSRFDQFILAGREQLRRERNEYVAGMAEDRLTQRAQAQAIEQTKEEQKLLAETLKQEAAEVAEVESSIADYSAKHADMLEWKAALERQITDAQSVRTKKKEVIAGRRRQLEGQNARNRPELTAWETQLGLKIDTAGEDRLRFTYTHINDKDPAMPHFFIVDLTSSTYRVEECHPTLSNMDSALTDLNRTRDFSAFLKRVRQDFKKMYHSSLV